MSDAALDLVAERIRVRVLSAPIRDAVPMSFGQLDRRQVCLVEVDAGGLTGVGESWVNYPGWAPTERVATLCDGVAPLVIGTDVADPGAVQAKLTQALLPIGRQWGAIGPIWQAISAIDVALWDLLGKARGQSVTALLRGERSGHRRGRRALAYASGVGPTAVAELCAAALEKGFAAVKVKVGFDAETDSRTLASARATLGSEIPLFADANQAWDVATALQRCELLADHSVSWLEEPLDGDRLDELEKLATGTSIPLATGENVYGLSTFSRYINSPAIHVIQPDLAKSGGLTMAREIADRAARAKTELAPHCYSSGLGVVGMLHLAGAFDVVRWLEYDIRDNPLRSDLLAQPLRLDRGRLFAPTGPGLGVELNPETVDRFQTHLEERTHHDF